ncbi:hypothetical protein ACE1SV_18630 [Streptomyces sp. E-15]
MRRAQVQQRDGGEPPERVSESEGDQDDGPGREDATHDGPPSGEVVSGEERRVPVSPPFVQRREGGKAGASRFPAGARAVVSEWPA